MGTLSLTHPTHNAPRLLGVGLSALWIADIVTTCTFVQMYGVETEANSVMRWVLESNGLPGFVVVKLAVLLLWLSLQRFIATWVQVVLIIVLIPVIGMNLLTIFG